MSLTFLKNTYLTKALGVCLLSVLSLSGCGSSPETSGTPPSAIDAPLPEFTGWVPVGARNAGSYSYDVVPEPDAFHTMHVGPNNGDTVWGAVAPAHEFDWVAESSFFIAEGPTFDNEGNLYFSPLFPQVSPTQPEDVSLISLNAETGERNWAIPGDGRNGGGGAILILNDPDNPGKQIIYHTTYVEAMAIRPDGTIIWRQPTGLTLPPIVEGEYSQDHSFGFNYHPETDSLVGVTIQADIFAFDRRTGAMVAPPTKVPGAPAVAETGGPNAVIVELADRKTDDVFGVVPGNISFFSLILEVIFGGGAVVTNYFAIDPNTSRIYVAATAEDEADGTDDGQSELGAIYALEMVQNAAGHYEFEQVASAFFQGGTGSTPTVSEDGQLVFVSDNLGNVIALDRDLNERWRADVGAPLVASVGVSPDNNEIYAVTAYDVFKLVDEGDSGRIVWKSEFDAFTDNPLVTVELQSLTPTIAANGIAVSVAGAQEINGGNPTLVVGMGLLDKNTGRLKSFTQGREESISISSTSSDGSLYTAGSPVRRVVGNVLYPGLTDPIIGGISRYKPVRNDLLARDAVCAASARAINASTLSAGEVLSAEADIRQIRVLLNQAISAISKAENDSDLSNLEARVLTSSISAVESDLVVPTLEADGRSLYQACKDLGGQQ